MSAAVGRQQRFTPSNRCPICNGCEHDPRGDGRRCYGFRLLGGRSSVCTREEHRGDLPFSESKSGYVHALDRQCRCGISHAAAEMVVATTNGSHDHSGNAPRSRAVDTRYKIRNADGEVVAVHVREDFLTDGQPDKKMWWQQPNGQRGLGGVRRDDLPLYGVHELTTGPAGPVIVAEGEKARDALTSRGIVALGTVTGEGGTPCDASLRPLLGRAVVLWPDHDDDGKGQRHMERIGAALLRLGHTDVRTITWSTAPPKGDAFDFFQLGGTAAQLADLIATAHPVSLNGAHKPPSDATPGRSLVLTRLDEIAPQPVTWLWPGRIPCGKVTMVVGDPGLGKSLMLVDLAARITRGEMLPGSDTRTPAADVIVLSAEDDPADTIRPRFDLAAGDPARVHLLQAVKDTSGAASPFSLDYDLPLLEAAVQAHKPAAVIIDPISCYLGDRDSHKDTEVRAVLAPLATLAHQHRVAVVVVAHLSKNEQRRALYRAIGSIGFVAAARSMLAVAPDPDDKLRRLVASGKANLAGEAAGLAYRVVGVCSRCSQSVPDGQACRACGVQSVARLVWEDAPVVGLDADRLLSAHATPEERDEAHNAEAFLRELLSGGDVAAKEGEHAARAHGIAPRSLDRARRRFGVKAYSIGFKPKVWYWTLSPKDATKDANIEKVASFGQVGAEKDETTRTSPKDATSHHVASFGGVLREPPASDGGAPRLLRFEL